VFRVISEDRPSARVRIDLAPGRAVAGHVLMSVPVSDGALDLRIARVRGVPVLQGLSVSYIGPSTRRPVLTWHDEFTGRRGLPPDPTRWTAQVGGNGWGNRELEYYTRRERNVALDGRGHLALVARREAYVGPDLRRRRFTSARLFTGGRFSFTYGRAEARIRVPAGRGLWPAFWTLGDDADHGGWPGSGEVDVMETRGDRRAVKQTVIGPLRRGRSHWSVPVWRPLRPGFHVFGMRWAPDVVQLTLDGHPVGTVTPTDLPRSHRWVFDHPQWLLLNVAVGGTFPGPPSRATRFPATMLVDWVRVWNAP
jgi:beta-glucanase (GH16 family)